MKLILASGSPRRSEILKNAGYEFVVKPTSADESLPGGILPEDAVKLLSERKADAAKIECSDVVLSADTVVALGDRILGKPSDKAEAFSMLRSLSGKTHSVYTGVTIKSAEKKRVFAVKTDVLFYPLTDDEINANKGRTFQDVTALRDPLMGLEYGEELNNNAGIEESTE